MCGGGGQFILIHFSEWGGQFIFTSVSGGVGGGSSY